MCKDSVSSLSFVKPYGCKDYPISLHRLFVLPDDANMSKTIEKAFRGMIFASREMIFALPKMITGLPETIRRSNVMTFGLPQMTFGLPKNDFRLAQSHAT